MLLEEVLRKGQAVMDFEVEQDFETIGRGKMLLNASALSQANHPQPMIPLAIENISERKAAEAALIKSEKLRRRRTIGRNAGA